jgi:hypothetical protein
MANILITLYNIGFVAVHVAGFCTSIYLSIKYKSKPAIFAIIAFGLLLAEDFGTWIRSIFLDQYLMVKPAVGFEGLNCFCGFMRIAAFVLLIIAIGEAVRANARPKKIVS